MKILYQESDVSFRNYVSMILSAAFDAEVIEVGNDKEGICLLEFEELNSFDLVIADYNQNSSEDSLFSFIKNSSNIPWVFLIKPENRNNENLISLVNETPLTILITKPFKDTDFIPVVENLLQGREQEFLEIIPEEKIEEVTPEDSQKDDNSAEWSIPKKKPHEREEMADWSVAKKYQGQSGEAADWAIPKKKADANSTIEADWSVKKKSFYEDMGEADWSAEKKTTGHNKEDEVADWSIEAKGTARENEVASWSIEAKGSAQEDEVAGWSVEAKGSAQEDEVAGWSVEAKGSAHEDEVASWSIEAKGSTQEEEKADWELQSSSSGHESAHTQGPGEVPVNIATSKSVEPEFGGYTSVSLDQLLEMNKVCCDVYLDLSKTKFLKVINAYENYDHDQLQRYKDKGKEALYIKSENAKSFKDWISKYNK